MRIATWRQLTDSSYLANTLLATPPNYANSLQGLQEQFSVSAYPYPTATNSVVVEKVSGQYSTTPSASSGFSTLRLARVDLRLGPVGAEVATLVPTNQRPMNASSPPAGKARRCNTAHLVATGCDQRANVKARSASCA
jgi:hypothetical protein